MCRLQAQTPRHALEIVPAGWELKIRLHVKSLSLVLTLLPANCSHFTHSRANGTMRPCRSICCSLFAAASCTWAAALPRKDEQQCRKTQVAIVGAGVAGITTAWALQNASVEDFVIVERNDYVGGRIAHTTFGTNPETGEPYTIELGANWVQGLGSPGGPENPIWTFAKQYNISNTVSALKSLGTMLFGLADSAVLRL